MCKNYFENDFRENVHGCVLLLILIQKKIGNVVLTLLFFAHYGLTKIR